MKRRTVLCLCLCLLLPAFSLAQTQQDRGEALHALSLRLLDHIKAGEETEALAMMDAAMQGAMAGQIQPLWDQLLLMGGAFEKTGAWELGQQAGYDVIEMNLVFSRAKLIQRTVFDAEGRVAGLFVVPGALPEAEDSPEAGGALPQGLREEDLTVDAGTGYPLPGTLTLPAGEPLCGLVLVHGSGPSDRDEAVLANAPFRDLAWGLALRRVAVLRYDKRTFAFAESLAKSPDLALLTVDEETALDAAAAVQGMKARPDLAGKPVFLLGHSLGGMLSAYINTLGAGAAGYINLAGSPRALWEIAADQHLLIARELEASGDAGSAAQIRRMLAAELEKADGLEALSDEAAQDPGNQVLGISAYYLRHLAGIDPVALHLADRLPVLILQGDRDRQVTLADYEAWQKGLAGHPDASFILYPGLNHLFGQFEGEAPPAARLLEEYAQRTPIPDAVLEDIAGWLTEKVR